MTNVAVIFAGGTGIRMRTRSKPKQFLELHGKPIIIHTLEVFDHHSEIDGIVVVCVADWIPHLRHLLKKFGIRKVVDVVAGGETGQKSIFNGLEVAERHFSGDSIVLIHDGVRPLIDGKVVTDNIEAVKQFGTAITTAATVETFVIADDDMKVRQVPDRKASRLAKAPQSFVLADILNVHRQAQAEGMVDAIDSCTLMTHYGREVTLVEGPADNIKITTPTDYFVFRAIFEARENSQIYGL